MFGSSYRIATIWGIPIKIHISLIVLLVIVALQGGIAGGPETLLFLILLEFCIFASIALHELGHSFVAMRKGCVVREITLMFIGGAAQMEQIPVRPKDEFQMAVAGPMVSLLLGLTGFGAGGLLVSEGWNFLGSVILTAGIVNFMLAGFNLLPSFPMDGGRVLRALLTPKLGRLRATFIAARLGKMTAVLFGICGLLLNPHRWILVAIAFFIYIAAGHEYRLVQIQEAAKRQGFGTWTPFGQQWNSHDDDEKVLISPPPYERGPGSKADIHLSDDDDPFKRHF